MKLGIVSDPIFGKHICGSYPHPESPERLDAALRGIYSAHPKNSEIRIPAREATREELQTVHTQAYVDSVNEILGSNKYGHLDPDTFYSPDSREAALKAVGGGIDLAMAVEKRDVDLGLVIARPPGHHATSNRSMGFCIFNNVAAAAATVSRTTRNNRAVIFDWDVHHGNGTQEQFWHDPNVLFISIHQAPFYPGTGHLEETGGKEAQGTIANIPLPGGANDEDYVLAMDTVVIPLIKRFDPGHILISAGFDAHRADPLAGMSISTAGYFEMASRMKQLADDITGGRLTLFLEGGYNLEVVEKSLNATVAAFKKPKCEQTSVMNPDRPHHVVIRNAAESFLG